MTQAERLTILVRRKVSRADFVKFWSSLYDYRLERLYKTNIGKPLTPTRAMQLFKWKNGGPIAPKKRKSIRQHFINAKPNAPSLQDREAHIRFIASPGGPIWRIFWLHCHDQQRYPIFDQHVFRAMKHILTGEVLELTGPARAKAAMYLDEYIPFFNQFRHPSRKRVDEALWSYGKHLKLYGI